MSENNLVLNLNDVDENAGGFECMPKGEYEAIVDEYEFGTSKKGAPMITWKFRIVEGEFDNRVLFFYTVLNQQFGLAALKKTLIALGMDIDWGNFDPQQFTDEGEAINLPVRLKVGIQKYEGEKRNTVKEVLASSEGGFMTGGF